MNHRNAFARQHEDLGIPVLHNTSRYEMIEKVCDEGSHISYWRAYDNALKEHVAVKRIIRGSHVDEYVERQAYNQRTLFHPHITRMREVVLTDSTFDIILDCAPERNLEYYATTFGPLPECHARHFFQQIVIAVDFCHKRATCVRDIRLENLALNAEFDIVKLQNFALSKNLMEQSRPHTRLAIADYAAPELVISDGLNSYDGFAADVWAIGVCLYVLLYGYKPFSDMDKTEPMRDELTYKRIAAGNLKIPDHQYDNCFNNVPLSENCLDLLHCLLEYDPQKRITIADIMRHPWFLKRLPKGALELNAAVDPIDDKLNETSRGVQTKSRIKELLAVGAQPLMRYLRHHAG